MGAYGYLEGFAMRREITLKVPVTGKAARLLMEWEEGPDVGRQTGVGSILLTLEAAGSTASGVLESAAVADLVAALSLASEGAGGADQVVVPFDPAAPEKAFGARVDAYGVPMEPAGGYVPKRIPEFPVVAVLDAQGMPVDPVTGSPVALPGYVRPATSDVPFIDDPNAPYPVAPGSIVDPGVYSEPRADVFPRDASNPAYVETYVDEDGVHRDRATGAVVVVEPPLVEPEYDEPKTDLTDALARKKALADQRAADTAEAVAAKKAKRNHR